MLHQISGIRTGQRQRPKDSDSTFKEELNHAVSFGLMDAVGLAAGMLRGSCGSYHIHETTNV